MRSARTISEVREVVAAWRRAGDTIAFVPTMGNLHRGHLTLVEQARQRATRVVTSIFVNPLQFGKGEDLEAYPRTEQQDTDRLAGAGNDLLFLPDEQEMYPRGRDDVTQVVVPRLSELLCGASRPGHFRGVATVVAKLFNIVQPDVALFGEKDYQQLLVIRRLTADLSFPVEVVGIATQREADGLAMSSRNGYLNASERMNAPLLYATLRGVAEQLRRGHSEFARLETEAVEVLRNSGFVPDYVKIRRSDLMEPQADDRELVVLAAAFLGRTRLIDNLSITRD